MDFTEIDHLLQLARLNMSEEEKQKIAQDLNAILDYVNRLQQIDTTNVEPMNGGTFFDNVLREDEINISKEDYSEDLKNAAFKRNGDYFEIPPIF